MSTFLTKLYILSGNIASGRCNNRKQYTKQGSDFASCIECFYFCIIKIVWRGMVNCLACIIEYLMRACKWTGGQPKVQ